MTNNHHFHLGNTEHSLEAPTSLILEYSFLSSTSAYTYLGKAVDEAYISFNNLNGGTLYDIPGY